MRWFVVFLVSCVDALPLSYVVKDLRVVAMVAQPPDANPGSTVTLTTHFSGPARVQVLQCPDRSDYACDVPSIIAEGDTHDDRFVVQHVLGDKPMNEVLLVRGDDGVRVTEALKRVVVGDGAAGRNTNPSVDEILFITVDGQKVAQLAERTTYRFVPKFRLEDLQDFKLLYFDGRVEDAREEAIFTWSCSPTCVIENEITYGTQSSRITTGEGAFTLYLVVRDGRGGEAFTVLRTSLVPTR